MLFGESSINFIDFIAQLLPNHTPSITMCSILCKMITIVNMQVEKCIKTAYTHSPSIRHASTIHLLLYLLTKFTSGHSIQYDDWQDILPLVEHRLHTTYHGAINTTPATLMFGSKGVYNRKLDSSNKVDLTKWSTSSYSSALFRFHLLMTFLLPTISYIVFTRLIPCIASLLLLSKIS